MERGCQQNDSLATGAGESYVGVALRLSAGVSHTVVREAGVRFNLLLSCRVE